MHHWHILAKIAVIAANLIDTSTTVYVFNNAPPGSVREGNRFISQQGRFTAKSIGIKWGITGGMILGQEISERKHPEISNGVAWGNLVIAGGVAGVGVHNLYVVGK